MRTLRFMVCGLVAIAFGTATFFGIGEIGMALAASPTGPLYSNLVVYPAVMLMGLFGFLIVLAASDPGTGK